MAFFDKVGATISSFGNDVSNKTKSMMEINNYSGQLKNCEESLKVYYYEIGKAYYQLTKDNPDPNFTEQFGHVREAEEAIDHLESAIRRAKGTKKCQSCGGEVSVDTIFCPSCGSKVDDAAACNTVVEVSTAGKCKFCGAQLKVGAVFCSGCGNKVEA